MACADRSEGPCTSLIQPGLQAVAQLLPALCEAGADEAVTTLLVRDPDVHASLDYQLAAGHTDSVEA